MFRVRLKELREQRGLSQNALAKELGISQSTVGMWESGKNKPEYNTLNHIADFFKVSVDSLIGREEQYSKVPTDDEIKFALFGGAKDITDEMYEEVKRFAKYVKETKLKENKPNP